MQQDVICLNALVCNMTVRKRNAMASAASGSVLSSRGDGNLKFRKSTQNETRCKALRIPGITEPRGKEIITKVDTDHPETASGIFPPFLVRKVKRARPT